MISKLYSWYGKTTVRLVGFTLLALLATVIVITVSKRTETPEAVATLPTVVVNSVAAMGGDATTAVIGFVEAINEARVQTETAGRVVSVNTSLGKTVAVGSILVQLENASQRAAVLQAEGVYEAAVAGAAQSDVSVAQAENALSAAENNVLAAKNNILTLYRSGYSVSNQILLEEIDIFYRDPYILIPSIKINPRTDQNYFVSERTAFRALFKDWGVKSAALSLETADMESLLSETQQNVIRLQVMVNKFISLLPREKAGVFFTDADIDAALNDLISANTQLNSLISEVGTKRLALQTAQKQLDSAKESVTQAQIGGSGGDISLANAQVKQALGALRSVQASLNKTILRAPISGQINKIDVKVGDFLPGFVDVATIANNNALQIKTFLGERDKDQIAIGDVVLIENEYEGIITAIAPGVDPLTKKVEVKISTETPSLSNGDTVVITFGTKESQIENNTISIPLTAVKFTQTDGFVFMVEENVLVAKPVTIGKINGAYVEISAGLSKTDTILVDARGRASGQKVEPINN